MPKQTRSIRFAPDAFLVRVARASKAGFSFAKIGLCLGALSAVLAIFAPRLAAQTQIGRFQDEFLNTSKIAQQRNVTIDTVQGLITLKTIADSLEESQNFRLFLSGVDRTFRAPSGISEIVNIDRVPGEDEVYLFTTRRDNRIFTFNAQLGEFITTVADTGSTPKLVDPVDSFPFRENGILKVLVTEERGDAASSPNGRIRKINSSNKNVEWLFPESVGISSDSVRSLKDAVMLLNRSEVLICDAGNNRLIAVDVNKTGPGAIVWRYAGGFINPVDVDADSSDPSGSVYLVTDQFNHRIELVQRVGNSGTSRTVFGVKGVSGNSRTLLNRPTDADFLNNGNILICDAGNNRLIEVTRQGTFVRQFAHSLFNLNDADRIERGTHQNKMVVAAKNTQTTSIVTAKRLTYTAEPPFISPPREFDQLVDFDTITWADSLPPGTSIKLQLRTVKQVGDTSFAQWLGPTGPSDFYTNKPSQINPDHDGDRIYQFRAFLETQSRLETPLLRAVKVKAHYFIADTTGEVVSKEIRDAANVVITSWRKLRFQSKLPTVSGATLRVQILDSLGTNVFADFPASATPGNPFDIDPERVPALRGRQAIRLRALFETDNAFVTPQLLNWEVEWSSVRFGPSQIRFANRNLDPLSFMRLSNSNKDSAYIVLTDPNAQAILDTITVQVQSRRVGDIESFFLRIDPTNRAFFSTRSGIPLVFANEPTRNNKKLEVRDRDTLFVSYIDPRDSNDRSNATAVVIQRVKGTIQIENIALSAPDTLAIGDQAFVRVLGETDHNLSPTKRDTIFALLRDPQTNDQESITLLEIANVGAPAVFNTGNFRSVTGITLVKEGSVRNDGKLFTDAGNVIAASFEDEFDRIEDFATVIDSTGVDALQNKPFLLEIAPNPYRTQSGKPFKLRAQVRTGELLIRKVEIFNLAGDRVTTLGEGQILFKGKVSLSARLGRVEVSNWWSLKDNSFSAVASGTYFAKFDVLVNSEPRSQVIKFVVIQ